MCCGDHSVHSIHRNEASDASVERPFQAYFERELSVLIVQRQVHEIWAGLAFENGVTNLGARVEGANTMKTIVPGSLSMNYDRIDHVILRRRAIGTSYGMEGSGLTRQSRMCVQTHVPT